MNSKLTIGIIVILVIVGIVFYLGSDEQTTTTIENESATEIAGGPSITAAEQIPGTTAQVDAVTLEAPGYIVVHKDNDGAPGDVIGNSTLLPSGTSNNILIELSESISAGSSYFLMLHLDDGNGEYNFPGGDGPVVDKNDDIVTILVQTSGEKMEEEGEEAMEESEGESMEDAEDEAMEEVGGEAMEEHTAVSYTNIGFLPKLIEIEVGDTVTWTNNSDHSMWVAADVHPTHTLYPIKTENDCRGSSFDACTGVPAGESWEFTFTEKGSWKYHNHVRSIMRGTIDVE